MTGSRFLRPKASRFLSQVASLARTASRFLAPAPFVRSGRRLARIVHRVPLVSKFIAFFAPDKLKLDTPAPVATQQPTQPVPHIAPVYNARARRRGPRLTL